MSISKRKNEEILNKMKACIQGSGLAVIDDVRGDDRMMIVSSFRYECYGFLIFAEYHAEADLAEIHFCYGPAPENKFVALYELMNHINTYIMTGHFYVGHLDGTMNFSTAVHVPHSLDTEAFEWALGQAMGASYRFFPMISEQLFTDGQPTEIFEKHLNREPAGDGP